MRNPLTTVVLGWLGGLRFPTLLLIAGGLFIADVLIPDFIPLIDELLLGLLTLLFASWKRQRGKSAD